MKKYITPCVEISETESFEMMALSLQGKPADDTEALSRDEDWNIWDEE